MTHQHKARVRWATPGDEPRLLTLMSALADFEGYSEDFCVTEQAITDVFFEQQSAQAIVAESNDQLVGMLVFYLLPFSYDLKPWWFIKELYVEPECRAQALGKSMMQALIDHAKRKGGSKIRWAVLRDNDRAQRFYKSMGAEKDESWDMFNLEL